ncbi:Oidioi.mRNA.OKI2018_I69.chr1.g453.t1.cds [Oikopleura dioica]|uniref:L-serine ammonia-lyase n=1 Tax=Oikopleura dioica TaxID=34765 RepID=A0ABN7SKE0_OIKDI|nr:Oidioi.mRNA.OKI2018_I69.chr1.g453.t1.cds [Oikopleura dioica]
MENFKLEDFQEATRVIREFIPRTALHKSPSLSNLLSAKIYLKLENQNVTGSFKIRGAMYSVKTLKNIYEEFITASSGNHGLACAWAFSRVNTIGKIYLPEKISQLKLEKLTKTGCELIFVDGDQVEVELAAKNAAEANKSKVKFLSPYNDLNIIRGQGTIGIEIFQQCPKVDVVFVTVGGGGLISGVAAALKLQKPSIKIYGCLPKNSPVMKESIEAGKIIEMESKETLSDGNEEQIIEGAAGVGLASMIKKAPEIKGKFVVSILCGGNIDEKTHSKILFDRKKVRKTRIVRSLEEPELIT